MQHLKALFVIIILSLFWMLPAGAAQSTDLVGCMEKIDRNAMQEIVEQGKKIDTETRSLCAAGKRDAAQQKAMAYVAQMKSSPVIKQLRECGMQVTIKHADSSKNICDELD